MLDCGMHMGYNDEVQLCSKLGGLSSSLPPPLSEGSRTSPMLLTLAAASLSILTVSSSGELVAVGLSLLPALLPLLQPLPSGPLWGSSLLL